MNVKQKPLIFILFFTLFMNTYPELLKEEIYFNADNTAKPIAKRFYQYDENNFIIKIIENYSETNDIIELKYTYDAEILRTVEEYHNGSRVKYSVFNYKNGIPENKTDYDNNEKVVLKRQFTFKTNQLSEISDFLPNGVYLGKRVFNYTSGILDSEYTENEIGYRMVHRVYTRANGLIVKVEMYIRDRLIRVIERKYEKHEIKENQFDLQNNFWDIR
ncbi:MAG: hypothetical protein A2015_10355 [Spirochaetes bacterium GWF1_31_7]|nr:MAG: hypothetical protein A2Y30_05990 [Spirochaetes bacterium GWE1_32_154]OHD49536.1 MAG: hypothetical protein A2Y29_02050 [Spirochaetes bacterium GWE2_31_10]OHD49728.1 MAG: hypothetical protein A2015_10355 [Spirochaetes bacterium GWF1_31_7]OHD79642.1 MAG: hypothetical protein A2355_08150 [Spirochaetes bacterium RIFOXYB1_FULL_32_8]HBD95673.1 hypothetical protein [Spirochaetia bacterium]